MRYLSALMLGLMLLFSEQSANGVTNLNAIVSFGYPACSEIAERAAGANLFIENVERNVTGTVLFINGHQIGSDTPFTIVVTTTNVSIRNSFTCVAFDADGNVHHWYDQVKGEWLYATGAPLIKGDRFSVVSSPDCRLVAIRRREHWDIWANGRRHFISVSNTVSRLRRITGDTNRFTLVGLSSNDFQMHSFELNENGVYNHSKLTVGEADHSADVNEISGAGLFAEKARFFPKGIEVNPRSGKQRKLPVCADFMFYVTREFATHLEQLTSKVRVYELK